MVLFDDYSAGLQQNLKLNCQAFCFNGALCLQVVRDYLQADLLLR